MPCANQLLYHPPWPFLVSGSRCHQLGTIQTMMATCHLAALVGPLNGKIIAMGCLHPPKIWCFPVKIFPKKNQRTIADVQKISGCRWLQNAVKNRTFQGVPFWKKKHPAAW